jgi:hypothetical protein
MRLPDRVPPEDLARQIREAAGKATGPSASSLTATGELKVTQTFNG